MKYLRFSLIILLTGILLNGLLLFHPPSLAGGELYQELAGLITEAVEDNRWLTVKSRQEAKEHLSKYYTGQLLEDNANNVWEFVQRPTDWHYIATVNQIQVHLRSATEAVVTAEILEYDIINNELYKGRGKYLLVYTGQGWRIAEAEYQW